MAEAGYLENPHGVCPLLVTFEVTPLPLGLRFLCVEIERGMAFLFRKMMTLGRHGLKELLVVAGYYLAQVLRDRLFVTSSWHIFRS